MEEQRRVQEAEIGRTTDSEGGQQNPSATTGSSGKKILYSPSFQIYSHFLAAVPDTQTGSNEMDVTRLTEDEQIALAIQMSMTQAGESASMYYFSSFLLYSYAYPI
jgi:hypothetical protein